MADEVDLADFRQRRRRGGEGVARQAGVARHVARRQAVAPPAGVADLEEQGGGLVLFMRRHATSRLVESSTSRRA